MSWVPVHREGKLETSGQTSWRICSRVRRPCVLNWRPWPCHPGYLRALLRAAGAPSPRSDATGPCSATGGVPTTLASERHEDCICLQWLIGLGQVEPEDPSLSCARSRSLLDLTPPSETRALPKIHPVRLHGRGDKEGVLLELLELP